MESGFTGIGLPMSYWHSGLKIAEALYDATRETASRARELRSIKAYKRAAVRGIGRSSVDPFAGKLVEDLASRQYQLDTIRKYVEALERFISWSGADSIADVGPDEINNFLNHLSIKGYGAGVRRLHLSALRTVLDRMYGGEATRGVGYPLPPLPRRPASAADMKKILAGCESSPERALILLLNVIKLRPGQIAELRWTHVDLKGDCLRYYEKNRGRIHILHLPSALLTELVRLRSSSEGSDFLFSHRFYGDRPMTVRGIQKMVDRITARAGVKTTCTGIRKALPVDAQDPGDNALCFGKSHVSKRNAHAAAEREVPAASNAQFICRTPSDSRSPSRATSRHPSDAPPECSAQLAGSLALTVELPGPFL